MKANYSSRLLLALLVMAFLASGCGGSKPEPTQPAPTITMQQAAPTQPFIKETPQPVQTQPLIQNTPQPAQGNETLSSTQKQQLAHATVRIAMLRKQSGKLHTFATGSGTIISPDGLILTNCHIADPSRMGYPEDQPDQLGIEIVDTEDQPPVPTYFARVVAADATLDLAVIQIDRTLNDAPIQPGTLHLPFVKIGDSDTVMFGETIYIFGFPGIGGDTITYASGDVSGFDRMEPIGNRAWIKTDAMIAGGNSGGLAANAKAEIIGIPSRVGTSSANEVTDCRTIADTNGDGVIDDKDTCVSTGGFINAIRPVNWALPLINSAQKSMAYVSPYDNPSAAPTPVSGGITAVRFTINSWTTDVDVDHCPTDQVINYPSGTKEIHAVFQFKSMNYGEKWSYRWLQGTRQVATGYESWEDDSDGDCFSFSLHNQDNPLPDGNYRIEIYSGPDQSLSGSSQTRIGEAGAGQGGNTVMVTGKVTDANTGKGIEGIYVVVLKPGIDPVQWSQNGSDDDIYTMTKTDSNGQFTLPDGLERGKSYGTVVGSAKIGLSDCEWIDQGQDKLTGYDAGEYPVK